MRLLLDTHVFVWMDLSPEKLSSTIAGLITSPENALFLSLASIWEMQIKIQLGKLTLTNSLADTITTQQENNSIQLLPITVSHVLTVDNLPFHHRDPFDRLLIAQSQYEGLTLLTNDQQIQQYNVTWLW